MAETADNSQWNTGLLGCLSLPSSSVFDCGGVPTGLIPPLLFWKIRVMILDGNEVMHPEVEM